MYFMSHDVVLIKGDGIGPEVIESTKKIIDSSGVSINWHECIAGSKVFKSGEATGLPKETIDLIEKYKIALKGPLETPIGYGEKSANVTLRKYFETYGNIRTVTDIPGVQTPYSGKGVNLVIVRENIEDLYAGIEHMQTPNVAQCLKLISNEGSIKISRLAFEYAKSTGKKLVTCATKANIMKFSEGLFKRSFESVSKEYNEINSDHIIIDNCAHMLVKNPSIFDVIVTTNMNGDIISDLASGLVGGLGLAPGANIGDEVSIFEAVHGSAPEIAGKNIANPTAVLLSGVMMLRHMGEFEAANNIEQALYYTMGIQNKMTGDIAVEGKHKKLSTSDFTNAIIDNMGEKYSEDNNTLEYVPISIRKDKIKHESPKQEIVGLDVFIETKEYIKSVGDKLSEIAENHDFKLKIISSRGMKVYPNEKYRKDLPDFLQCRFLLTNNKSFSDSIFLNLIGEIQISYPWVHIEKLKTFDGVNTFSKAHGES